MNKNEKINGWLPCFDGFYNSIFEFDDDSCIYNITEDRQEKGLLDIDNYHDIVDLDYKRYEIDFSKIACDVIEKELKDFNVIESIEFETLVSPKEYNFSTDSINVIYSMTEDNKKNVLNYIENNTDEFEQYIKENYTSRSGFFSSYTNDFNIWLSSIKTGEFEKIEHMLSSIFQFILLNEKESSDYSYQILDEFKSNNGYDQYINNYEELIKGSVNNGQTK